MLTGICIFIAVVSLCALSVIMQRSADKVHIAQAELVLAQGREKDLQLKIDEIIKDLETRVQQNIFAKTQELEGVGHWLEGKIQEVLIQKKLSDERYDQGTEMANWAKDEMIKVQLFKEAADKLVHDGKREVFEAKEGMVYLYNHYKVVVELLGRIVEEDDLNYEQAVGLLQTASTNMYSIEENFKKHFRKTPTAYKEEQIYLSGKRQNGETYLSSFGKN